MSMPKQSIKNEMRLDFLGIPENESFARVVISAFAVQRNPTLTEIEDIKTAVSEAVTNAIIHGYPGTVGMVRLAASLDEDGTLHIEVQDAGCGMADVARAREPFYTSRPEMERSGMGFTVMESFMTTLEVVSTPGRGTTVRMTKQLGLEPPPEDAAV